MTTSRTSRSRRGPRLRDAVDDAASPRRTRAARASIELRPPAGGARGISLLEVVVAALVIAVLAAVLLPLLGSARMDAYRRASQDNLRRLGTAWEAYLETYERTFPYLPVQGAWRYGGVRFLDSGEAFLDPERPLNVVLTGTEDATSLFRCPADAGIGSGTGVGTGSRSAYEAFGTSYRANGLLFDVAAARQSDRDADGGDAAGEVPFDDGANEARGVRESELRTVPSRLVVMGEPLWWELREGTGRSADWFGDGNRVHVLFLDGSVKHAEIRPRPQVGPAVVEPSFRRAWESREPSTPGTVAGADGDDGGAEATSAGGRDETSEAVDAGGDRAGGG